MRKMFNLYNLKTKQDCQLESIDNSNWLNYKSLTCKTDYLYPINQVCEYECVEGYTFGYSVFNKWPNTEKDIKRKELITCKSDIISNKFVGIIPCVKCLSFANV